MNFESLKKENILHDYEQIRLRNKRLLQDRQDEIYEKIPEIKHLQRENKLSYLALAKKKAIGEPVNTEDVSNQNRGYSSRIQELLLMHGYPATYLDPIYDCPICKDLAYVDGKTCACFQQHIIDALYRQSNMTGILNTENFDTFNPDYYSRTIPDNKNYDVSPYDNAKNILQRVQSFVRSFATQPSGRGNLLLYGDAGLGKTFLTNCIAKALLDEGHTILYLSANDLFQQVFEQYLMNKKFELEELYNYIYNSELLIIDDLGTEMPNAFFYSELFDVINKRGLSGKSTAISTNLSLKELQERYSERIMSRIVESYTVLHLYGENIRYQKRKNQ